MVDVLISITFVTIFLSHLTVNFVHFVVYNLNYKHQKYFEAPQYSRLQNFQSEARSNIAGSKDKETQEI